MNAPLAYLNGAWIPASEAKLPVYDAGIVMGATFSEFTRTFAGRPFRLDQHLTRLRRSLDYGGISPEESNDVLEQIALKLLEHNLRIPNLNDSSGKQGPRDLGIIHFVTAGEYATYATMSGMPPRKTPTVCVHTFELPFSIWRDYWCEGVPLVISTHQSLPAESIDPGIKCRSRMHYFLADQQARRNNPRAQGLLVNRQGSITETNTGNIFMVRGRGLVTPPVSYTLDGISRRFVLELAEKLGYSTEERDLDCTELETADEVLLSSTGYCLLPVSSINSHRVGTGPGPVCKNLIQAWSEMVGVDITRQINGA